MDGISIASSIISIATAGIQVSIKLVTLSTQVSTASERVSSIANDVSLTSGVLHQLGDLMTNKTSDNGIGVFNQAALDTTRSSAAMCETLFEEIGKQCGKASEQMRRCRKHSTLKVKLSRSEKLKWPFLQPSIEVLRTDLREAKGTLMLMLQINTLAVTKKMADISATAYSEQEQLYRVIIALEMQQAEQKFRGPKQSDDSLHARGRDLDQIKSKPGASQTTSPVANTKFLLDLPVPMLTDAVYQPPNISSPKSTKQYQTTTCQQEERGTDVTSEDSIITERSAPSTGLRLHLEDDSIPSLNRTSSSISNDDSTNYTGPSTLGDDCLDNGIDHEVYRHQLQSKTSIRHGENEGHLLSDLQGTKSSERSLLPENSKALTHDDCELQMFMVKPIVKDFFDKIELSWSVLNPKMQVAAIRDYLERMKADDSPSVVDVLETLHRHEHSMLKFHQGGGDLRSIKRTRTDIQHRDILFKDIPGFQFVVEVGPESGKKLKPEITPYLNFELRPGNTSHMKARSRSRKTRSFHGLNFPSFSGDASKSRSDEMTNKARASQLVHKISALNPKGWSPARKASNSNDNRNNPFSRSGTSNNEIADSEEVHGDNASRAANVFNRQAEKEDDRPSLDRRVRTGSWEVVDAENEPTRADKITESRPPPSVSSPAQHTKDHLNAQKTSTNEAPTEIFKSFRVPMDETTQQVIPAALKKHNIVHDGSPLALYIKYGDQERCLGLHEKPLLLFKQLDQEGKKPSFMLRRHEVPLDGYTADVSPAPKPSAPQTGVSVEDASRAREAFQNSLVEKDAEAGEHDALASPGVSDYSDDSDDEGDDDDTISSKKGSSQRIDSIANRELVDDLLQKYTTWRPNHTVNLPGGIL